jgi:hypothetical protein
VAKAIFVFGSNLDGMHEGGAARFAAQRHGAALGVGEGITESSYALPTVGHMFSRMPMEQVEAAVARFLSFAAGNPEMEFQVTRVGCGIAGFADAEIAALFTDAPTNCSFDSAWSPYLPTTTRYWGTF